MKKQTNVVKKVTSKVSVKNVPAKTVKKAVVEKPVKKVRRSIHGFSQKMIRDGATYKELGDALIKEFNLPESKLWYVNWNFSHAVRSNAITEEQRQVAKGKIPPRDAK